MASAPNWPYIVRGYGSNAPRQKTVKALQSLLNYRINAGLLVDGDFGNNTYNAVRNFQSSWGLYVDGEAGQNTLLALITDVSWGVPNSSAVSAAQHLLTKFDSTAAVDGVFGEYTHYITKGFQFLMQNLQIDGVIGSNTWRWLFGYDWYPGDGNLYYNFNWNDAFVLSHIELGRAHQNKPFYQTAVSGKGLPWQMLAAVHYRETKLQRSSPNADGPFQIPGGGWPVGSYTDLQFQNAANAGATYLQSKAVGLNMSLANDRKKTFFLYNGAANAYKVQADSVNFSSEREYGGGSPYVVNRISFYRDPTTNPSGWGQIKVNGGGLEYPANYDFGAILVYDVLTHM